MKGFTLFALLLLLAAGCRSQPKVLTVVEESARLHSIAEGYFEAYLQEFPIIATYIGDHRFDDRLGNSISEQSRQNQRLLYGGTLAALDGVRKDRLSREDTLTYELLRYDLETK